MNDNSKGKFAVSIDLDVGTVTLDNANIKKLYFIEDVFSYTMTGKIVFNDNKGVFEYGPLTGNEVITITYGEEDDVQRVFKIYKVSKIDQQQASREDSEIIEIFFAERMFFLMNFLQFSRSWKDTKISDIVRHIGDNHLNVFEWDKFEDTQEKLDHFYIPYWNMNTTMNWLTKRGTGAESGEPGFCFFNNTKGTNFITLEKLLSEKKLMDIGETDGSLYVFSDANEELYNKILNWSISGVDLSSFKYLSGGTIRGYNSLEKSFIEEEYEYSESADRHTMLGKSTIFPDISNSRVSNISTGETKKESLDVMFHNSWNKRYTLQHCVSVTVRGHEDRHCGGLIEILWPSMEVEDHYHKHMHGRYLVKSITHVFSGDKKPTYKQKLVCIKNGYGESDARGLYPSTKRNN